MTAEKDQVNWTKVAWMSAIGGLGPWLLGLAVKQKFEADYREATRVRWTDAARWEKPGRDY